MTEYAFASATSRRGAAQTDVGGNIFKLQLNPHQLVSQGCDSQAETTWREGDAAPAPAACPAWTQAVQPVLCSCITLLWHQPCKKNQQTAVFTREQAAAAWGTTALQPRPGAPGAMQAVGGNVSLQHPTPYELQCGLETHVSSKFSELCFKGERWMETCFFMPRGWFK